MLMHDNGVDREMTEAEIVEHEAQIVEAAQYAENLKIAQETKLAAKQKLANLGLTELEINALIP